MDICSAEIDRSLINNDYYHRLGDSWYTKSDDPIALLRAESKRKLEWIVPRIAVSGLGLDVGCGGGFVSNALAEMGFKMTGLDFSLSSLQTARAMDKTESVQYIHGDAYCLPFANEQFNFVVCLDFLEHVSRPDLVIAEIARVLKPNGRFIFHTFNRNWLSYLIVIKGIEWLIKNTPRDLHVYRYFLKPEEVEGFCGRYGLNVVDWTGCRPILNFAFAEMLYTGIVSCGVDFKLTRRRILSYLGEAIKSPARP